MRTIKFRGKSFAFGTCGWVYGSLEVFSDDAQQYARIKFDEPYTDEELGITIPVGHDYLVDPETVGQFTGLYDKNGKEIYEGDIIRVNEFENILMNEYSKDDFNCFDLFTIEEIKGQKQAEYVSQVRWEEGCFSISTNGEYFDMSIASLFGDMKRSQPMFECEVIGNIHDQKEETK